MPRQTETAGIGQQQATTESHLAFTMLAAFKRSAEYEIESLNKKLSQTIEERDRAVTNCNELWKRLNSLMSLTAACNNSSNSGVSNSAIIALQQQQQQLLQQQTSLPSSSPDSFNSSINGASSNGSKPPSPLSKWQVAGNTGLNASSTNRMSNNMSTAGSTASSTTSNSSLSSSSSSSSTSSNFDNNNSTLSHALTQSQASKGGVTNCNPKNNVANAAATGGGKVATRRQTKQIDANAVSGNNTRYERNMSNLSNKLAMATPSATATTMSSPASKSMQQPLNLKSATSSAVINANIVEKNSAHNHPLIAEVRKVTAVGEIEETAPGQFKCRFCDKTFDRIFSVHRHERVHTGFKPCICKACGRGFSEKRNLRHHIIRFHSDGSGRELLKRNRARKVGQNSFSSPPSSSASSITSSSSHLQHMNINLASIQRNANSAAAAVKAGGLGNSNPANHIGNSNSSSSSLVDASSTTFSPMMHGLSVMAAAAEEAKRKLDAMQQQQIQMNTDQDDEFIDDEEDENDLDNDQMVGDNLDNDADKLNLHIALQDLEQQQAQLEQQIKIRGQALADAEEVFQSQNGKNGKEMCLDDEGEKEDDKNNNNHHRLIMNHANLIINTRDGQEKDVKVNTHRGENPNSRTIVISSAASSSRRRKGKPSKKI